MYNIRRGLGLVLKDHQISRYNPSSDLATPVEYTRSGTACSQPGGTEENDPRP